MKAARFARVRIARIARIRGFFIARSKYPQYIKRAALGIITSLMIMGMTNFAIPVQASAMIVHGPQIATCASGTSCGLGAWAVVSGNTLVALMHSTSGNNRFTTPTDTLGDTFTQAVCANGGSADQACIYTATAGSSSSNTITCKTTASSQDFCVGFEVSGVFTNNICTASGSGTTSSTTYTTSSSCSYSGTSFTAMISCIACSSGSDAISSAGTGYSLTNCTSTSAIKCAYGTGVSSPTNFPLIASGSPDSFLTVGISIPDVSSGVAMTLKCQLKESGATTETGTLSGGSVSPTNPSCSSANASTSITCTAAATITFTVQADGSNTRYRFNGSATTGTFTCTVSTTAQLYNYYQLQNTYSVTPVGPTTWDAAYSVSAVGTVTGTASSSQSVGTTSGGGGAISAALWFDYNLQVSLPSAIGGFTPIPVASNVFTQTTGGNTDNTNYYIAQGGGGGPVIGWLIMMPLIVLMLLVALRRRRRR